jgi:hypothetical protein
LAPIHPPLIAFFSPSQSLRNGGGRLREIHAGGRRPLSQVSSGFVLKCRRVEFPIQSVKHQCLHAIYSSFCNTRLSPKHYPGWNFYFTNVSRQGDNVSMATYEASLGRETSTNYAPCQFHDGHRSGFLGWSPWVNLVLPNRWNEKHRGKGNVWISICEQGPVLLISAPECLLTSSTVFVASVCRDICFASVHQ